MPEPFHFGGFTSPRYTQTPDELFDVLLPVLSGAELKVLLYIIRRTFGWRKEADMISLSQIMHGITKADGTPLDRGTGLAKSTAIEAIKGLEAKGCIEAVRSGKDGARGYETTTYRPCMAATPLSDNPTSHVQKSDPPLVRESDLQETAVTTHKNGSDNNWPLVRAAFKRIARDAGLPEPPPSLLERVQTRYERAHIPAMTAIQQVQAMAWARDLESLAAAISPLDE
jgi:hypothetical protein